MTKNSSTHALTELEGCALAVIKREGPCTPYQIRHVFERSPADFWSGSAGSIYPLIRRLENRGIITAIEDKIGAKKRKLYSLSPGGEVELKAWLLDVEAGASIGFDPMRTRLHSAKLYELDALEKFVERVISQMLAGIPAPESEDPKVAKIHDVWLSSRKAALEEIVTILKTD